MFQVQKRGPFAGRWRHAGEAFCYAEEGRLQNVSLPSPINQLVLERTDNVFVAANVVLMEPTIEARSEIGPPQDDVSTQFRKTSGDTTSGVQALRKSIGTAKQHFAGGRGVTGYIPQWRRTSPRKGARRELPKLFARGYTMTFPLGARAVASNSRGLRWRHQGAPFFLSKFENMGTLLP